MTFFLPASLPQPVVATRRPAFLLLPTRANHARRALAGGADNNKRGGAAALRSAPAAPARARPSVGHGRPRPLRRPPCIRFRGFSFRSILLRSFCPSGPFPCFLNCRSQCVRLGRIGATARSATGSRALFRRAGHSPDRLHEARCAVFALRVTIPVACARSARCALRVPQAQQKQTPEGGRQARSPSDPSPS